MKSPGESRKFKDINIDTEYMKYIYIYQFPKLDISSHQHVMMFLVHAMLLTVWALQPVQAEMPLP